MTSEEPKSHGMSWPHLWLVLAGVLFSVAVVDVLFGLGMDRIYARSSQNPVAQIVRSRAQTIIAGSSTAKYSLAPAVLAGTVYNAGENGQSGYYVAALLGALPENSAVRRLIFVLDLADIADGLNGANTRNLRAFAPWAGRDRKLREWIAHDMPAARWALRSGLYRYRTLAPNIIARWLWPRWRADGFTPLQGSFEPLPSSIGGQHKPLLPDPSGFAMLEAITAEVSRRQLELVVLVTPILGQDRSTDASYRPALEAMRRVFAKVKFCDLTSLRDERLDRVISMPALFHDGPHLNGDGARHYTGIVSSQIRQHCRFEQWAGQAAASQTRPREAPRAKPAP
jgi:hypothetical protein